MDGQTSGTNENIENQVEVDPWVAAFAALEPKGEEGSEEPAGSGTDGDNGPDSDSAELGGNGVPGGVESDDGAGDEAASGGLGDLPGEGDGTYGTAFGDVESITDEDITKYEQELDENIRKRAINEVAEQFVKRGIRNRNGVLGATLDDPDICKRDEDGVPHFYNPETGQEFRGDNPRRQAQEWVDDYNKELARVYNDTCAQYENHLKQEAAPQLAVVKFKPKYDKLDDIRKGMFDNVIEDYEIHDDTGKLVGYSCDLDKALALVERQITMIQNYAKQHQPQPSKQQQTAHGPALDMKTSSGAVQTGDRPAPKSLAEAMERLQDAELEKFKR